MGPTSLTQVAADELEAARSSKNGRSARTVHGGRHNALRQTLLALTAGHSLAEHENPGEATLHVLQGRIRLTTPAASWEAKAGDHLVIPDERHGLDAIDDSVVLLTVVASVDAGGRGAAQGG